MCEKQNICILHWSLKNLSEPRRSICNNCCSFLIISLIQMYIFFQESVLYKSAKFEGCFHIQLRYSVSNFNLKILTCRIADRRYYFPNGSITRYYDKLQQSVGRHNATTKFHPFYLFISLCSLFFDY